MTATDTLDKFVSQLPRPVGRIHNAQLELSEPFIDVVSRFADEPGTDSPFRVEERSIRREPHPWPYGPGCPFESATETWSQTFSAEAHLPIWIRLRFSKHWSSATPCRAWRKPYPCLPGCSATWPTI